MIFRQEESERQTKIEAKQYAREMERKKEQRQHEIDLKMAEEKTNQFRIQQTEYTATASIDLERDQCKLETMKETRKMVEALIQGGISGVDLIPYLLSTLGNKYTPTNVRKCMPRHSRGRSQSCAPPRKVRSNYTDYSTTDYATQ